MSGVDDRVVQLKFDNAAFEAAVATTLQSLDKLKKSLDFTASKQGLDQFQTSANRFNLGNVSASIDSVNSKFLALATIGVTALSRITDTAITTGVQLAKSLTIDPIQQGFSEYQTNLNAIQTILSNTQSAGTNLKQVNAALLELNHYSDQTIYNFSEMAKNIGTFTAAGVGLKESTSAIKGIANLAALSGSNSQQAATAMYQLSQAIAAGKVNLVDWNSVVNAGMGGTVFQRALTQTAVKMGTIDGHVVKLKGSMKNVTIAGQSFRESLSQGKNAGWLTSDVLTKTLAHFTGDLTDAQLAAEGFSKAEIKTIQLQARTAKEAATVVKTLPQLLDVTKEAIGSGWSETWSIIFGNFEEAKKSFTDLSNSINTVVQRMADARNALLNGWKALGGRTQAIQILKEAFKSLYSFLNPIRRAFRDIFPKTTSQQLYETTVAIRNFFQAVRLGPAQMELLRRTFAGFFAILDIGKQIFSGVLTLFSTLGGTVKGASTGFLSITAHVADLIVKFDKALKQGNVINTFFRNLGEYLKAPVAYIGALALAIGNLFSFKTSSIDHLKTSFNGFGASVSPVGKALGVVKDIWQQFTSSLKDGLKTLDLTKNNVQDTFKGIKDAITNAISGINWDTIFKGAAGAGAATFIAAFARLAFGGLKFVLKGKALDQIANSFQALTGVLQSMQNNIRAKTLLYIAGAILALAVAVKVLTSVEPAKLIAASAALAVLFGELIIAFKKLDADLGVKSALKLPLLAGGLILLSTAIVVLVGALKILSTINTGELVKGIISLGAIFGVLAIALKPLVSQTTNMIVVGAGLILVGGALLILSKGIEAMAAIDNGTLVKGIASIAAVMVVLGVTISAFPTTGMIGIGAGLILVAIGLTKLVDAVAGLGSLDLVQLVKGLGGIGVAMFIISAALKSMPENSLPGAAAMVLISFALGKIKDVILDLGATDWQVIAKGLITVAGALAILAVGLGLMETSIHGAYALAIAAGALMLLVPVLQNLGAMNFTDILKGLFALAGVFAIIGVASIALSEAIPFIFAFGVAIAAVGLGVALLGAGALGFATAFQIIVQIAQLGIPALMQILTTIVAMIPAVSLAFSDALIGFALAVVRAAPAIGLAVMKIIEQILLVINKELPNVLATWAHLVDQLLLLAIKYIPKFYSAGLRIITGVINGIADNVGAVVKAVVHFIVSFLDAIASNYPKLLDGAAKAIIKFVEGISKAIDDNAEALGRAGGKLAGSIIKGLASGITGAASEVWDAISGVAQGAIDKAKEVLHINSPSKVFIAIGKGINEGFVLGIASGRQDVIDAMSYVNDAVAKAQDDAIKNIKSLKEKLARLENTKKKSPQTLADIARTKNDLAEAISDKKKLDEARKTLTKERRAQEIQLIKLGDKYDKITEKIKNAQQAYLDAIKARDDYTKSITDKYSALPALDATTSLKDYLDGIRLATANNIKFKDSLKQLRNLGLDDNQYRFFLEQGVAIQPVLDQLLASAGGSVSELNAVDKSLVESAKSLGKNAGDALYNAGINAAKGLLDGLESQLDALTKQMKKLGKAIADELKKELGIKSPSKVFEEIGGYTMAGLAKGMDDHNKVIDLSARRVGKTAIKGLKDSMANINDVINGEVDTYPVIAPVLDLDQFRKDALGIDRILGNKSIAPAVSLDAATSISATQATAAETATQLQATGTTVEFTQTINSPKPVNPAEVYRNTKNLLSIAKGVVP